MATYHLPLFERLLPKTEWRGGRTTDTDILTLDEAAKFARAHAGQEITPNDFLRAAARGEICLLAIVHRTAKVHRYDGGVYCNSGAPNENIVPDGAIPNLPQSACQHLAAAGRASWRTFDGFKNVDGLMHRFAEGILDDGEPDFETVVSDCRVRGYDAHALADAYLSPPNLAATAKPIPRSVAQEAAVLQFVGQAGLVATGLIRGPRGKRGPYSIVYDIAKADASFASIFSSKKVFEKAWQRLLDDGRLKFIE